MGAVRTVLVGAGRWGTNIARTLKELENEGLADLSYVVDLDLAKAKELSERYGFREVTDSIDEARGEAYIVATPIDTLYVNALRAASAAACVFIEKPAAQTYREATELFSLIESRKLVHQVGYLSRFDPVVTELRNAIRGRSIYALRFRRLSRRPPHMRSYPITLDLMSHDIDLAFFLLSPREVRAMFSTFVVDAGVPQRAVAGVIYDGVDVLFEADGRLPVKIREVDVLTDEGIVRVDLVSRNLTIKTDRGSTRIEVGNEEPLKKELRVFLERCGGRNLEAPTLREAAEVLKVIDEVSMIASRVPT